MAEIQALGVGRKTVLHHDDVVAARSVRDRIEADVDSAPDIATPARKCGVSES